MKVLHDYLKLTYKVDIQDIILLEGYVKGGWIESIVWGTSYYVVLSIVLMILGILIVKENRTISLQNLRINLFLKMNSPWKQSRLYLMNLLSKGRAANRT